MLRTPRSFATTRQPSLSISPRTNSLVASLRSTSCHGFSRIGLKCFLPGPCCGRRHGQCFEYSETTTHPLGCCSTDASCPGNRVLMATRHRSMTSGYFLSRLILRRHARGCRETHPPGKDRADNSTHAPAGQESREQCRVLPASPSIELAAAGASPTPSVAECRSVAQSRSH